MWEMKVSANKVLIANEKRCTTLQNHGVGVTKKIGGGGDEIRTGAAYALPPWDNMIMQSA